MPEWKQQQEIEILLNQRYVKVCDISYKYEKYEEE